MSLCRSGCLKVEKTVHKVMHVMIVNISLLDGRADTAQGRKLLALSDLIIRDAYYVMMPSKWKV